MKGYTIDVRGFSENKKKRVQDAFFKLGIKYETVLEESKIQLAQVEKFTNVFPYLGRIKNYLMWGVGPISVKQKPYEITYEQLMEEAGMNTKTKISPEDEVTITIPYRELLKACVALGKTNGRYYSYPSIYQIAKKELGLGYLSDLKTNTARIGGIDYYSVEKQLEEEVFGLKETPNQIKARELREQMEQMAKELKQLEEDI